MLIWKHGKKNMKKMLFAYTLNTQREPLNILKVFQIAIMLIYMHIRDINTTHIHIYTWKSQNRSYYSYCSILCLYAQKPFRYQ